MIPGLYAPRTLAYLLRTCGTGPAVCALPGILHNTLADGRRATAQPGSPRAKCGNRAALLEAIHGDAFCARGTVTLPVYDSRAMFALLSGAIRSRLPPQSLTLNRLFDPSGIWGGARRALPGGGT